MKFWQQPRQPLVGLLLFAAVGIVAAERWPAGLLPALLALPALALVAVLRRPGASLFAFVACAFFLLHDFRAQDNPGKTLAREFSAKPLPAKATGVVIEEPEEKQPAGKFSASRFRMRLESIEFNNRARRCDAVVLVKWLGKSPVYGDRVSIDGDARNLSPLRNPGQFDYTGYLNRLGIYSEIRMSYPAAGRISSSRQGSGVIAFAHATRRWMQERLRLDLNDSPEAGGLIQSMVLGLKGETPDDVRELFQRTGTLHLFVVNGLHIGMFAAIVFFLIKPLGAGRRLSVFVVVPLIFFYALLTGFSPGSVRASIMASIILAGQLVDRKPVMLNNLAAAGLALLLWDTNELFMPGFQFSFGVVLTIILLAGRFQRFFMKFGAPDSFLPRSLWSPFQNVTHFCWRRIAQLLGVSTAAWIGSMPFTATYFHLMSPSAVAANLVIVPVAFVILTEGILAILAGAFSNLFAGIFNNANWLCARFVLWAVHLFAQIPGGHLYVELPRLKKPPPCEITVFDLGNGGAIHIRSAGRDWLLDCGNQFAYESAVRPYLRSRGVNRLDGLGLSHGSAAFIGAIKLVADDFRPAQTVESALADHSRARNEFHRWLANRHVEKIDARRGSMVKISDIATIRVLYPPPDISVRASDDKALVLRLDCAGARVLFVSSSGFLTERWLLDRGQNFLLRSDILVKNQNGADISGTPDFINAVKPKVIVCSAADFPASARIEEAWGRDVVARGIRLFRQDETGAVRIELGRDEFTVRSFIGGQTFRGNSR